MGKLYGLYSRIFAKKIFYPIHKRMYLFSLRGMGILNSENDYISGEYFLQKYLQKKDIKTIFDVGANEGQFAELSRRLNPKAEIYSFEPHPINFSILENKAKVSNLNAFNVGLGKEDGILELFDYKSHNGSQHASLSKSVITYLHGEEAIANQVKIITIDDFCIEHKIEQIDLLKIDVEGFEFDVLSGAKRMLDQSRIKHIQFEFNANNIMSKTSIYDFKTLLKNYRIYRILPDGMIDISYESHLFTEIFCFQNLFAELKGK